MKRARVSASDVPSDIPDSVASKLNILPSNLTEDQKMQFWSRAVVHAVSHDDTDHLEELLSEVIVWNGCLDIFASYFCFARTLTCSTGCSGVLKAYNVSQDAGTVFGCLKFGLYGWFYLLEDAISADDVKRCEHLLSLVSGDWDGMLHDGRYPYDTGIFCFSLCCDHNAVSCFKSFLKRGLPLEKPGADQKTVLFELADSRKKLALNSNMVRIGLLHGGSLEGEFTFNSETVLSITTWKIFETLFPQKAASFFEVTQAPWIDAVCPSVIQEAWARIEEVLMNRQASPMSFDVVGQAFSSSPVDISESWKQVDEIVGKETNFDAYLMMRFVFSLETRSFQLPKQLEDKARELLFHGCTPSFSLSLVRKPQEWIAQYRGIFYRPRIWSCAQVELDGYMAHLNRILPAGATYSMIDKTPGQTATSRESRLIAASSKSRSLQELLQQHQGDNGRSQFCELVEIAACNYATFNKCVLEESTDWGAALKSIKSIGYPTWASSDFPTHAVRYALGKGDKYQDAPYSRDELEEHGFYNLDGSPKRKFFGKVFIALVTIDKASQAVHVMEMARKGEIDLGRYITPERETGYWGALELGDAWFEMGLEVPDLSQDWTKATELKFGVSEAKWKSWKVRIQKDSLDIAFLTESGGILEKHWQTMLLEKANEEAKRRQGTLVYWDPNSPNNIAMNPPVVPSYQELFKYEIAAMHKLNKN